MKKTKTDLLKKRMIAVKDNFPLSNYTDIYQYQFGLKTVKELYKIRQVWNTMVANESITKNFEYLLKVFNKKNK